MTRFPVLDAPKGPVPVWALPVIVSADPWGCPPVRVLTRVFGAHGGSLTFNLRPLQQTFSERSAELHPSLKGEFPVEGLLNPKRGPVP
jgi:hypothetical protein